MKVHSSAFVRCCILLTLTVSMAVCIVSSTAYAYLIDVVSQEYSVQGTAWACENSEAPPCAFHLENFQQTSSSYTSESAYAESVPGLARISGEASASISPNVVELWSETFASDIGLAGAYGSAVASIIFTPLANAMRVSAYGEHSTVSLVDLTSGSTLYSSVGSPFIEFGFGPSLMPFDPSHTYMISSHSLSASDLPFFGRIAVASVPEPATLLILASGLAGLGGFVWRHHRG